MKHLILGGGKMTILGDKAWVDVLLKHTGKTAKIAMCMFAIEEAEWTSVAGETISEIKRVTDKRIEHAILEADTFMDVSAWADVIIIAGGDAARLKNTLEQYGDLMSLWNGKTIAGSSAGADIMCQRYMYLQDRVVQEGFGWVPVNMIPHWEADFEDWKPEDWQWAAQELAGGPGEAPLLCMREGDFVEIKVA
jgi:cyanophycinase-like exopeptidase